MLLCVCLCVVCLFVGLFDCVFVCLLYVRLFRLVSLSVLFDVFICLCLFCCRAFL